jgi:hypothetical protein
LKETVIEKMKIFSLQKLPVIRKRLMKTLSSKNLLGKPQSDEI